MLNEIVDHKKDITAISKEDGLITTKAGRKLPKRTTKGWQFLCQWNDGTTSWHPLKDVKESYLHQPGLPTRRESLMVQHVPPGGSGWDKQFQGLQQVLEGMKQKRMSSCCLLVDVEQLISQDWWCTRS